MADVTERAARHTHPKAATELRRAARWIVAPPPEQRDVDRLAAELALPAELCRLLVIRGHADPDVAKRFLRPRIEELHDAAAMLGMHAAVDRLERAVRAGEMILVHGDYDVDGICSTTILINAIRALGGTVTPFIPNRMTDGYDLGAAGVRAAREVGARVVVTCDCGTSAREAVAALCAAEIDVIISDHHLPGSGEVPQCTAVLNPRQAGCQYPDKDLAAAGVAFKLALMLTRRMGGAEGKILAMLDLVALATIADVAPLRGENRILSRLGIRMMRETRNIGLGALLRSSGLADKSLTAGRIGFILAPRLNAIGRLDSALRGVELLLSEAEGPANALARELEEFNRRRQDLDRAMLALARDMVLQLPMGETYGIVLAHEGWHPGVVGIVASRLVEEFGRPAVLIALENGRGKGSGRSIPAFDLHSGLSECAHLLERYGGHRSAAGVTIAGGSVEEFARQFNAVVQSRVAPEDLLPEQRVDLEMTLGSDVESLERLLRHFEPFGVGNPSPVFLVRSVQVVRPPRKVGESGIRFRMRDAGGELDVLGWGFANRAPELAVGRRLDVVFRLERDEWNGDSRLQGRLLDFRSA